MKRKYIVPTCKTYEMIVEGNLMDLSVKSDNGLTQDYESDYDNPYKTDDGFIENDSKGHHGFSVWDDWDD